MAKVPPRFAGMVKPPETDVTRGDEAQLTGDYAKAATLYKKACDAKVSGGCGSLALLYKDGKGVAKDPSLAETMAKQSCDASDGGGCFALGIIVETVPAKDGKYRPASESIALYDKGCTLGDTDACNALGMVYVSGRGGAPKDPTKAVAALQRGCDLGDRMSCNQIPMIQR